VRGHDVRACPLGRARARREPGSRRRDSPVGGAEAGATLFGWIVANQRGTEST
jgi:hypothetical protein